MRAAAQSESGPPSASILIMETGHHHHHSQDDTKQSAWHHADSHTDPGSSGHKYSRERLEIGDGSDLFSRPFPFASSPTSFTDKERPRVFPECTEVTHHPRYIEVKPLEPGSGPERHYDTSISVPSTSSSPDKRSRYQRHSPDLKSSQPEEDSTDNCQTSQVSLYKHSSVCGDKEPDMIT